jgi:hypothetical protein
MFSAAHGILGIILAVAPSTERSRVDFDLIFTDLAPHGHWVADEKFTWIYLPEEPSWRPYRQGRWFYTDYGWTWQGTQPGSWASEHYGFWSRQSGSGRRGWVPDVHWLPATIEWMKSGDHVGWRAGAIDRFSNMIEPETLRYADPKEWNWVKPEKLAGPLGPKDFADDKLSAELLVKAEPVDHVFLGYREIARPGPSPDVLKIPAGQKPPTVLSMPDPGFQPSPAETKDGFFVFRPYIIQDMDGILRRIQILRDPAAAQAERDANLQTIAPKDPEHDEKKRQHDEKQQKILDLHDKHMEDLYK